MVNATNASGGHFRFHTGKSPDHSASLTFNVAAGKTGKLTYYYGTSTKGGTADVVLDWSDTLGQLQWHVWWHEGSSIRIED